jgi:ubiquinone/menaquinone biosynthesis C-methylase UbiE
MRINVGCGKTPTLGWRNFDNSLSLRLTGSGRFAYWALRLGLLNRHQYEFIKFAQGNNIEYGDATRGLPIQDGSVDVLYSSHMLEHLDRDDASRFLKEARRLLKPGGVIRLVVPDIKTLVNQYISTGDADIFIENTLLWTKSPRSLLASVYMLIVGSRNHKWMYDGKSLSKLLGDHGFVEMRVTKFGETMIASPAVVDLYERDSESVCVEAISP